MVFPDPTQPKGTSLEKVESLGIWRCPSCAEVEKRNKELEKEVLRLTRLLELNRDEEGDPKLHP